MSVDPGGRGDSRGGPRGGCQGNEECDDSDACTADACSGGACTHTAINCDDGDGCTDDSCDPQTGCVHTAHNCDDSDPCTTDACSGGSCTHTAINCNNGTCVGGNCNCDSGWVGQFCDIPTGRCCTHPGCQQTTQAQCDDLSGTWTMLTTCGDSDNDGVGDCDDACPDTPVNEDANAEGCSCSQVDCDDGNACTNDSCTAGVCSHTPVNCDDGNPCTTDACISGACTHTPINCNDSDACTDDSCDTQTGLCVHTVHGCDDSNACTDDGCDSQTGCTHTDHNCDDGNACTDDGCDPQTGCTHTAHSCDDSNACTTDSCDTQTGCINTPVNCDDGDACTDDGCAPQTGCTHTARNCDDGDACTTDTCDSLTGCIHTPINCNDGDACTNDYCAGGTCHNDPIAGCCNTASECDDGAVCTTDTCQAHACVHTPVNGCCHNDGECTDNNACTDDTCDTQTGVCHYSNNIASCDDGDPCTQNDTCSGGACAGTAIDCNDNNLCTDDSCVNGACVHANNSIACDDGDSCTVNDACSGGACQGSPMNCNDNNPCTDDSCVNGACVHTNNSDPCDDSNACTSNDTCSNGACVGTASNCDDGNTCTTDSCNPLSGNCVHTPIPGCHATVSLDPPPGCINGNQLIVEINLSNAPAVIVGGQFFLGYDNSVLDFVSADPGDAPFLREIHELVNEGLGEIDYAVGINDGGTGTSANTTMARLTFNILQSVCTLTPNLVYWRPSGPSGAESKLSDDNGDEVGINPADLTGVRIDNSPPSIDCPPDVTVSCYFDVPPADFAHGLAGDNCCTPTVTWVGDDNDPGICPSRFSITRTYKAEDCCGNTTTCTQVITVDDETPPSISCPTNATFECDGAGNTAQIAAWLASASCGDGCGGCEVTNDYAGLSNGCGATGTATVTFTATDDCGNTSTCTRTVTVSDTTAPGITCPTNATFECDGSGNSAQIAAWLVIATCSDACGGCQVTNDYTGLSDGCGASGTATVVFTAADDCGNTSTCTRTVTVSDTTPPAITSCPGNIPVHAAAGGCSSAPVNYSGAANDVCNGAAGISFSPPSGSTFPPGSTTVTMMATDACGNTATCAFSVTNDGQNEVQVAVELGGGVMANGSFTRCIRFELWNTTVNNLAPLYTTSRTLTFSGDYPTPKTASALLTVPCNALGYTCITARDRLHTLRRTINPLPISGPQYLASFSGAKRLIGGNLNDDKFIDILDFGIYTLQDLTVAPGGANTNCTQAPPFRHADITGNSLVNSLDFSFIANNFLEIRDANCDGSMSTILATDNSPGGNYGDAPLTSITVAELRARGMGNLAVMDLNHDGVFDMTDVALWMQGVRPTQGHHTNLDPPPSAGVEAMPE